MKLVNILRKKLVKLLTVNKDVLNKSIDNIMLSDSIIKKLKLYNINKLEDIWILKRNDLKKLDLSVEDIREISVKLQLNGLDLNKKIYN